MCNASKDRESRKLVERIVADNVVDSETLYFCKWQGLNYEGCAWGTRKSSASRATRSSRTRSGEQHGPFTPRWAFPTAMGARSSHRMFGTDFIVATGNRHKDFTGSRSSAHGQERLPRRQDVPRQASLHAPAQVLPRQLVEGNLLMAAPMVFSCLPQRHRKAFLLRWRRSRKSNPTRISSVSQATRSRTFSL